MHQFFSWIVVEMKIVRVCFLKLTLQAIPQEDLPSSSSASAAASTAVFSMDTNLSITKSVPTSLSATRSNQHSRHDNLGDMKSERTHARAQVNES